MKLNPDVFVQAAELVDAANYDYSCEEVDAYCCFAIHSVINQPEYIDFFKSLFEQQEVVVDHTPYGWWGKPNQKSQQARIIALLLAAEIANEK